MAIPLLEGADIAGKDVTADALLTQRTLADHIVAHGAHYHFTVKGNQPTLQSDIALYFDKRGAPDYSEPACLDHGRIASRHIWCTTELNGYLNFPHVAQAFVIERETINKKSGQRSNEIALGITSSPPEQASPERLLKINRGHWRIESTHYIIDWNYDEDRGRIRTGQGPENVTRLRRFAVGLLAAFKKPGQSIAQMMRKLSFRTRIVLDYLRMTDNATRCGAKAR